MISSSYLQSEQWEFRGCPNGPLASVSLKDLVSTEYFPKALGGAVAQVADGNTLAAEKLNSQLVVSFPHFV